jgi:hypothetical protein
LAVNPALLAFLKAISQCKFFVPNVTNGNAVISLACFSQPAKNPSVSHGLILRQSHCPQRGILFQSGIRNIAIIGGGPAGLRAAEVAAASGATVTLFDAKPSVGRKFLVAGRGGLNLTHAESSERFATRYHGPGQSSDIWPALLAEFDATALRQWAADLGVETFAATSGRVYPRELKAAPLLRRWVQRLRAAGVQFALRHRWT